ncbi:hypothetical protein D9M71_472830 [compost metagenome]
MVACRGDAVLFATPLGSGVRAKAILSACHAGDNYIRCRFFGVSPSVGASTRHVFLVAGENSRVFDWWRGGGLVHSSKPLGGVINRLCMFRVGYSLSEFCLYY